jgi:penicillin-binding protein 2
VKAADMNYWERDHAWFASFAPAEDPEVTVVVLNEHSGFGGASSAPAAGAILKRYFELKKADAHGVAPPPPTALVPFQRPVVALDVVPPKELVVPVAPDASVPGPGDPLVPPHEELEVPR